MLGFGGREEITNGEVWPKALLPLARWRYQNGRGEARRAEAESRLRGISWGGRAQIVGGRQERKWSYQKGGSWSQEVDLPTLTLLWEGLGQPFLPYIPAPQPSSGSEERV